LASWLGWLCAWLGEQRLKQAAAKVAEASFAAVWNNDEDAACDRL
jgi:hypothetical protein